MKIGLALGGGAVYGFAHIGVLKVLERNGIRPDIIAGTSVGSLIGGIYASGVSIEKLEKIALDFNWFEIAGITIPKQGLVSIEKLEDFIEKHSRVRNIEDTKIKFSVATTNLLRGVEEVFEEGPMAPAIRASCSLPGIFNPTVFNDGIFVDGGVINNVPTDIVKKNGADFVMGVDITAKSKMDILKHKDIFNIVWKSWQIAIQENTSLRSYSEADIILMPDIKNVNPFDITKKRAIIEAGERAAEREISDILRKIKSKKSSWRHKIRKLFK